MSEVVGARGIVGTLKLKSEEYKQLSKDILKLLINPLKCCEFQGLDPTNQTDGL